MHYESLQVVAWLVTNYFYTKERYIAAKTSPISGGMDTLITFRQSLNLVHLNIYATSRLER